MNQLNELKNFLNNHLNRRTSKRKEMKSITTEGCELALEIGPIIKKKFKRIQFPILFALIDAICKNQKLKIKW